MSLLADVGDSVTNGQILAELDKVDLQAQVREAAATRDGEAANLQAAIAAEAKARIEAANPDLEFARRDFVRMQDLFTQKISSQQQLDDASRAHEVAKNRQQLLDATVQTAGAQVEQARARVAAAKASWTGPKKPSATPRSAPPFQASSSPGPRKSATRFPRS